MRSSYHLFIRAALLLAVPASSAMMHAQEVGGYAWSFLRRAQPARETALAGVCVPNTSGSGAIFNNGAALAFQRRTTATLSTSFLPLGQRLDMGGVAFGFDETAGLGVGVARYGVGNVKGYNAAGTYLGAVGGQDIAISVAGGMRIGPGAVGATLRYLRFDPQGTDLEGTSGYAVDLSGTMAFDEVIAERDALMASAVIENLAGEQKGPSRPSASGVRLSGAYLYPLGHAPDVPVRTAPTGIPEVRRGAPTAYVMGVIEIRTPQYDPLPPSLGVAVEWALAEAPIGLRLGWNSATDLTAGFFIRWPADLVIDVAATRDAPTSSVAGTTTLTFTF